MEPVFDYVQAIIGAEGVLLSFSAALFGFVKVYKTKKVQKLLLAVPGFPKAFLWGNLTAWVRSLLILFLSIGGHLLGALASGGELGPAVVTGFVVAFTAMGGNSAEKRLARPLVKKLRDKSNMVVKPSNSSRS